MDLNANSSNLCDCIWLVLLVNKLAEPTKTIRHYHASALQNKLIKYYSTDCLVVYAGGCYGPSVVYLS